MAFGVLRKPVGAIAALSVQGWQSGVDRPRSDLPPPTSCSVGPLAGPGAGLAEQPGQACGGDRSGPRQRRWMVEVGREVLRLSSRVLARALAGNEFRLCCVTLRHGWSAADRRGGVVQV